ncbi:MAG: hypothetical protein PHQ43_01130 [Dehalococcoidales bacterium]|nr:hypothetical protein [Dehalococcoidales bacterium]
MSIPREGTIFKGEPFGVSALSLPKDLSHFVYSGKSGVKVGGWFTPDPDCVRIGAGEVHYAFIDFSADEWAWELIPVLKGEGK